MPDAPASTCRRVPRAWRWLIACAALLLAGCATLRERTPQEASWAQEPDPASRLGVLVADLGRPAPGESMFRLLESGRAALVARLALVERAQTSLDLQYYLIHADTSGRLLARAILRAADRGVRVRVLLDDVDTGPHEAAIIGLDAHPNIQIRLFNPFSLRGDNPLGRLAEFLGDGRLNHRMHNKLFVADNLMAIAGGRNIGDEYFQADSPVAFHDLDVLAAGPVVRRMSDAFDAYWNSHYAVSVRAIPKPDKRERLLQRVREGLERNLSELDQDTLFDYMGLDVLGGLAGDELSPWLPGRAEFISDPPGKVDHALGASQLPLARLLQHGLAVRRELLIASPYFVPGRVGVDLLTYLHGRGVSVRILTNSMAATDVLVVHGGYARYRLPLVLQGIELYELKPVRVPSRFLTRLAGSSSRTSLHSKVLVFDRESTYVGSMNLDPRSLLLNTESGLLIHSPALAERAARHIEREMRPAASYRLRAGPRAEDGRTGLLWQEGETSHADEPKAGFWLRLLMDILSGMKIEDHL
ncbi:MAG: phospholipase D family protein [Pseudomonadota bacterium]